MKNLLMLNLQLFANTVQTTLLSGLSAEMKTYYDMNLINEASANLVHDQVRTEASYSEGRRKDYRIP